MPECGAQAAKLGLPDDKPVSVPRPPHRKKRAATIPLGRRSLAGSSDLPGTGNGAGRSSSPIWSCSAWGLPCRRALLRPRCALTAPFHPYPATDRHRAVLFSVALSVKLALSESPRPLAGMLPYGDRTFLRPRPLSGEASGCLSGRPDFIIGAAPFPCNKVCYNSISCNRVPRNKAVENSAQPVEKTVH